ncbi:unnamed protein product, partial [Vitis vinifera]
MMDGGLKPPFPMWDRLLIDDIWGKYLITDSPWLHMQVIRLSCGGFVLAHTFNHSIFDTHGAYLFIIALFEFCLVRFVFGEEENLLKESRKLHSSLVSVFCFL